MVAQRITVTPSISEVEIDNTKRKLLRFVQYMRKDYQVGIHHKAICDKLDKFLKGEIKRLMIFVPPQHGKSELSSRFFPAFVLGHKPNAKVVLGSYSDELAASFNRDVQRIIDTDEYRRLFPETVLNGYRPSWGGVLQGYERNTSIFEVVGKRGSFRVSTIPNGQLTGQPADIAIIDDPVKNRLTAESETNRKAVWDWYTDTLLTRLHNDSQQLLLMTRWHEDDLAGRLLTQDEERKTQGLEPLWEVVQFAAIQDVEPTEIDPRPKGAALWPERHNLTSLAEKREKGGERSFNSLYQQKPTALEGNLIKAERFGLITWEEFEERTKYKPVSWDFKIDGAYTEDAGNDPTALYASFFDRETNLVYIREVISVRLEFTPLTEFIKTFALRNEYGPFSRIKVEPKANGLSIVQSMKLATDLNIEKYEYPFVEGVSMYDKSKTLRAIAVTPRVDSGRVVLIKPRPGNIDWPATFKKQCAAFPLAAHDDEVDCLVNDLLERFFGPKPKKVETAN
jgi:predicted phage terminase large subunit-like protein